MNRSTFPVSGLACSPMLWCILACGCGGALRETFPAAAGPPGHVSFGRRVFADGDRPPVPRPLEKLLAGALAAPPGLVGKGNMDDLGGVGSLPSHVIWTSQNPPQESGKTNHAQFSGNQLFW